MIAFYSGLFVVGIILSAYNWFYLQEVETAKIRMGLALPRKVILLFRGIFFACLFACVSAVLMIIVTLSAAR